MRYPSSKRHGKARHRRIALAALAGYRVVMCVGVVGREWLMITPEDKNGSRRYMNTQEAAWGAAYAHLRDMMGWE